MLSHCCRTMLFAVVSFDETNETDFLPLKWMVEPIDTGKLSETVKNKTSVRFYWPPMKNPLAVSNAKSRCSDAELHWPVFSARILSTAGKFTLHQVVINGVT